MDDDLDALLKQPIALPDAGFSRNVMQGVMRLRRRRAAWRAWIELGVVASILFGISSTDLGGIMERFGDTLTASQPITTGLAALLLGWLVLQAFGRAEKTDA